MDKVYADDLKCPIQSKLAPYVRANFFRVVFVIKTICF